MRSNRSPVVMGDPALANRLLTMRFRIRFVAPRLDKAKYRKRMHAYLSSALGKAAFAWIAAALQVIPVWSGASHATFLRLAMEIDFRMSISPDNAINRVALGHRMGEGVVETDPQKGIYTFTYSTSLPHLIWNEYHNANVDPDPGLISQLKQPGPYHFQDIAAAVAQPALAAVRLPSPWDSLTLKSYRV
jgi:hypothetical protein